MPGTAAALSRPVCHGSGQRPPPEPPGNGSSQGPAAPQPFAGSFSINGGCVNMAIH